MDGIGRVDRAKGLAGTAAARTGNGAAFGVPATAGGTAPAASAVAPAALDGLLLLQEGEAGWGQDRPARRHADALLDELAALQRSVLDGAADPAVLARLASLSRAVPHATDPRLRDVLRAAATRAAVELARGEHSPAPVT